MEALLLLFVCALLGIVVGRTVPGSQSFVMPLNWWVLNIALPALVLELIPRLELSLDLWFLPVSQWLVFGGAWLCFHLVGRMLNWSPARVGCLTLVAGLGNTMFIAYPVIEAAFGRDALPYAVVADQAGTLLVFTVGGAIVAALYGGKPVAAGAELVRGVLLRLLRIPALYALVIGLVVGQVGAWPVVVDNLLLRLGATLTPLALFSAGLQFRLHFKEGQRRAVVIGVAWKLVLAPAVVALVGWIGGVGGMVWTLGTIQAAMPPMISAAILASQHDLEPGLANTVLALGILLSMLTLPLAILVM